MSEYTFNLPDSAYGELAALAKHAEVLSQFKEFCLTEDALDLKAIARGASAATGVPMRDALLMVRGILHLRSLAGQLEQEPAEIVEAVTRTIDFKATERWKREHLDSWKGSADSIANVLTEIGPDSNLAIVGKSQEVEQAHASKYVNAKIFTSIRPVFNGSGDSIRRMVVYQELILTFLADGRPREIQFALDASDVVELKKQCERAQLKAATVKTSFADSPWTTRIVNAPGSEND